ncbi:MAG: hypothetical protein ACXAC2_01335 [Candidatus Kariarchaeaceae archaeon]
MRSNFFKRNLMILAILLIICPQIFITLSADQETLDLTNSSLYINQIEFQQPDLYVKEVEINNNKLPEDGEMIVVDLKVLNEDNVSYIGFELMIEIEENVIVQHGPKPPTKMYNKSLGVILAESTTDHTLSFPGFYGQYILTAALTINGTILPNSVSVVGFQVINQPIGSVGALIVALSLLVLVLLAIIAIPSIFEKLKSKN